MKKILTLMMVLAMSFSLVACGGEETSAPQESNTTGTEAAAPSDNNSESSETDLVSMNFGNITMNVPNVFSAVEEKGGMYITSGPNSSITVSTTMGVDLLPEEWDESLVSEALDMLYGNTYSNMELAAFEGGVNMNGNTAVYYAFNGTNANGEERLAQVILLYNADLTAQYVVTFVQTAGDEFYTPELNSEIINSITLAPEAQNLAAEIEG